MLTWCSQHTKNTQNSKIRHEIWVVLPLSWPVSCRWNSSKNMIQLAQEEAGEKWKAFKIHFEDDQYEVKNWLSIYSKFTNVLDIDFLYVWSANSAKALASKVKSDQLPSLLFSPDETVCIGNSKCMRIMPKVSDFIDQIDEYLVSKNVKKVAVIHTQDEWVQRFAEWLIDRNNTSGYSVKKVDTFEWGATDFRPVIAKIISEDYDAVWAYLAEASMWNFVKQAREAWFEWEIIASDYMWTESEIAIAGKSWEWVVLSYRKNLKDSLAKKYEDRFGKVECIMDAIPTYDTFTQIFQSYEESNSDRSPLGALQQMNQTTPWNDTYTYTTTPEWDKFLYAAPVLKIIRNWKSVPLYAE